MTVAVEEDSAVQDEPAALDAYSRTVMSVAERLIPSVASLKVMAPVPGGRRPQGSGSAVAITADGFLLTSAHVVERSSGGVAVFADGAEAEFGVVGSDPLSDLAVIRTTAGADGAEILIWELGA